MFGISENVLICFPNWNKSLFWYVSHFVVFSFACCNTRCEEAASVSRVPACALHTCVLLLTAIVILNLFRWEKERISIMLSIYLSSIHYHFLLLSFAMMTTLHNFHLFWTIDRISWGVENIRIFFPFHSTNLIYETHTHLCFESTHSIALKSHMYFHSYCRSNCKKCVI